MTARFRPGDIPPGAAIPRLDPEFAWAALLAVRRWKRRNRGFPTAISVGLPNAAGMNGRPEPWVATGQSEHALIRIGADGDWESPLPPDRLAAVLLDLYLPIVCGRGEANRPFTVGHLGQSLDGRIATVSGISQWVTGEGDLIHTHRMRALADAVLVGAGTVEHDDPRLTVRRVEGENPMRVILDPHLRLRPDHAVFTDGLAPTLRITAQDPTGSLAMSGVETIRLPERPDGSLDPARIFAVLAERGVETLFVEGGGVTVSRFLQERLLDRLQLTIAPVLIGSGRPAITLPEVDTLTDVLRPRVRVLPLENDIMVECALR